MKLALVTHAEHPKLRGTLPDIWPEFMAHDPVVQAFWPQLYDQYPDFQIWSSTASSGDAQPSATRAACPSAGTRTRRRAASTGR